jgi:hypothetical protein
MLVLVLGLAFLLGFRLGGESSLSELTRIRAQASEAAREMHELTRAAFVAMAEEAQVRRLRKPEQQ